MTTRSAELARPTVLPRPGPAPRAERVPGHASRTRRGRVRGHRTATAFGLDVAVLTVLLAGALVVAPSAAPEGPGLVRLAVAVAGWLAVLAAFGSYTGTALPWGEQLRRLAGGGAVGSLLVLGVLGGTVGQHDARAPLALGGAVVGGQLATRAVQRRAHGRFRGREVRVRTALLGAPDEGSAALHASALPREVELVGQVVAAGRRRLPGPLPVLGEAADLASLLDEHDVGRLVVLPGALRRQELRTAIRVAREHGVEVRLGIDLPDVPPWRVSLLRSGPFVTAALPAVCPSPAESRAKRGLDVVLALLLLVLLSPVLLAVAALVRLTSSGPAFYPQDRVTRGGQVFRMYKFRTMRSEPPTVQADLTAPFFKAIDDPRLTPVGRVLRRTSLDELPQLLNVVKGDMSLVGPRPLPVEQVRTHPELLHERHVVRAGMTGWWQVNGRSDVDPRGAVAMDMFYVRNWSLSLDLHILARTVGVVLRGTGAY